MKETRLRGQRTADKIVVFLQSSLRALVCNRTLSKALSPYEPWSKLPGLADDSTSHLYRALLSTFKILKKSPAQSTLKGALSSCKALLRLLEALPKLSKPPSAFLLENVPAFRRHPEGGPNAQEPRDRNPMEWKPEAITW